MSEVKSLCHSLNYSSQEDEYDSQQNKFMIIIKIDHPQNIFKLRNQLLQQQTMNILTSRLPALKFLAMFGAAHLTFSLYSNATGQSIMTIQQYMQTDIKEKTEFTVVGMLKPRSIKLEAGLNKKFVITDNTYDLNCKYAGTTAVQLKQGQTTIITGYCPNIASKQNIVVNTYMTKHSMEKQDWDAKNKVSKKSYGLDSFR